MELFQSDGDYIVQKEESALWCSRVNGRLSARPGSDLLNAWNPVCLGEVEGVIGKIKLHPDLHWHLLLIRQKELVGVLPGGHEVYKVSRIACLPLSAAEPCEMELQPCKKHHFGIPKGDKVASAVEDKFLLKTLNHLKSNVAAPIKKKTQKDASGRDRLERRLLEELVKMFTDSDSFFFSPTFDLTSSVQRQRSCQRSKPLAWQECDDRFFWNKLMLQDLIDSQDERADFWIMPVIQGFVQIEKLVVKYGDSSDDERSSPESPPTEASTEAPHPEFLVALISRRSRHRAGMRYKRRGVDRDGHVANFVETEQLIHIHTHTLSFVQTRGSVPVYWSQAGYTYNPRPQLTKGDKETRDAFEFHFKKQLEIYQRQVVVNLVDQAGREKIIGDTFLKHVLHFNSKQLTYITFDFHEHCRGMKFENVHILTDAICEIISDMKWCWADAAGLIQVQQGVFRVNCMDCLDRTNVVQAAIARIVMESQLKKLGAMPPEHQLPIKCRRIYQVMWANHGDTVSRQYAGTAALKGDFTRTGERRFAGVMKDGYNSANRYYLNQFRDAYRQAAIDLMQGLPVTDDLSTIVSRERHHEALARRESRRSQAEQVSQLLQSCMKQLLPSHEEFHGGWALIDCDPSLTDATHRDVDVLLILTNRAYYVAYFDEEADKITHYQRIDLADLEKIEIGPEPTLFGKPKFICMRVHSTFNGAGGYFHTLRAATRSPEDSGKDTLQCITEIFQIVKQTSGGTLLQTEGKLEKKKSKPHEEIIGVSHKEEGADGWSEENFSKLSLGSPSGRSGLAQSKRYLAGVQQNVRSKFSSLNQRVKQSKPNVNLADLGSNFRTLRAFEGPNQPKAAAVAAAQRAQPGRGGPQASGQRALDAESDPSLSDSDSMAEDEDEFGIATAKSDDERHASQPDVLDYVLPSCGIVASAPPAARPCGGTGLVRPSSIVVTDCSDPAREATRSVEEFPGDSADPKERQEPARRPSRLDIACGGPAAAAGDPRAGASDERASPGGRPTPTSAEGSRTVSPFARIKSSMAQMANMPSPLGLLQGMSFPSGRSPEPDSQESQEQSLHEIKAMMQNCQTRIIQI
ncbi:phosphatidylinositide phosphatase SAC2 isoform X1 [Petromyzon marinus]|uniref:phosphatidylinositide phosphatase SAC2 isoform X1 n=1 Tax=Petromyzon marinus TaxID=7757 RepID=UPI003F6F8025